MKKSELERMRKYFDAEERLRERVLEGSRSVVRASARAISAIHRRDFVSAKKMLAQARMGLAELRRAVKLSPAWRESGLVQAAEQEYCEAALLNGLVKRGKLFGPEELRIPHKPYLAALADVGGELRRHALDLIRADDVVGAERALGVMEEIYEVLASFDYPEAILPGLRRRRDVLRGILERTRGDLTIAIRQQRLERALKKAKRRG